MDTDRALSVGILLLGLSTGAAAHPGLAGVNIPAGTTVTTTRNLPGGGTLVNDGTITTGNSPGVTSTGPGPVNITNNGTITSNTTGVRTSGNSSSALTNNGTISVGSTVTSKNGPAKATVGTGISQQAGP